MMWHVCDERPVEAVVEAMMRKQEAATEEELATRVCNVGGRLLHPTVTKREHWSGGGSCARPRPPPSSCPQPPRLP